MFLNLVELSSILLFRVNIRYGKPNNRLACPELNRSAKITLRNIPFVENITSNECCTATIDTLGSSITT